MSVRFLLLLRPCAVAFLASPVGPQTSFPFSMKGCPVAGFFAWLSFEKRSLEFPELEFLHGGVYQYMNVPQSVYDEFMGASSKGNYFDGNIRNVYPTSKVG